MTQQSLTQVLYKQRTHRRSACAGAVHRTSIYSSSTHLWRRGEGLGEIPGEEWRETEIEREAERERETFRDRERDREVKRAGGGPGVPCLHGEPSKVSWEFSRRRARRERRAALEVNPGNA